MTCPACGSPTVPAARFCFHCGAALAGDGGLEVGTERRVVTVLFGDLSDFTGWAEDLDPERVGVVTDRVLATLSAAVSEFGGQVDKLTGDGLMAVFGAPTAHEDDPERAVRAAARMQTAVRRVVEEESGGGRRLGLRVGLNTGVVVAGVQAHLSYTVIGDTVNTAARLADAAGVGAVLAGKGTATTTMAIASWRALAPLRLKGKRDLVTAYELVGLRPAGAGRLGVGDEAPFLGRDAELGLLVGRLLDAQERRIPRSVLVTGEAGVGKTRLAQELARFAGELPEARVLWGRCPPYGEDRDVAAVAQMVATACGVGEGDDDAAARGRIARTVARLDQPAYVGPVSPTMTEHLQALLGVGVAPAGPVAGATPGGAASRAGTDGEQVRESVRALFAGLAVDGPLVLVLDDLHWATPGLLRGLLDIATGLRGAVLMLGLGRPDLLDAPGLPGWWQQLPEAELLPLLPLEDAATERLLRAYLGPDVARVDDEVRSALLSRAQGNPFFLAELLHLLVDRGVLVAEEGRWVLGGPLPADVPAGVHAVLAARIDDLDGAAKGVLRDASVLGSRVSLDGLQAVGSASGHGETAVVERAVRTLVGRRLLEPEAEGLRFTHTLVRDVAYAGLAKSDRARRHAAAAAHLAGTGAASAAASHGERAVRLATEMGLPPRDPAWAARGVAFTALRLLGSQAQGRDDHVTARRVLTRALALGGPDLPLATLVEARVALAQSLVALHRLDEAEEELASGLGSPDDAQRAAALLVLGEVRRRRGDLNGARQALVSALAAASTSGTDRRTGEAIRQLGLLDYFEGRLRAAEERFRQALVLARQVDDPRGAAWALQHLAWSATTRGDYALADATLDEAADLFSSLDDAGGLSWVAGTEGFVRLLQGRFAEARELAGSVLPLGDAAGERWGVAALLTIDAIAAAELGDVGAARDEADAARRRFEQLGDDWGSSLALVAAGLAARAAGESARAITLLDEAVERSRRAHHPLTAGLALVALGYVHLDDGDLDGAEAAAAAAKDVLGTLDLEPHAALGAAVLMAQVLRGRGSLAEALGALDEALGASAAPALLFPARQALAHRAGLLLDLGRVPAGLEAARAAVAAPGEDVRSRVLSLRSLGRALALAGDGEGSRTAFTEAVAAASATAHRAELEPTRAAWSRAEDSAGPAGQALAVEESHGA